MPQIIFSEKAHSDIERLRNFLIVKNVDAAISAISAIRNHIVVLQKSPFIGRVIEDSELRELIVPFSNSGYIVLYKYYFDRDLVVIVAIKHQKEDDYE
ncbi:MAG: type II toxin-antitoxin system RelE/ParE family toxin [Rickettsiales bacterium]